MSLTIEVKYYDNPNVVTYDLNWSFGMNIQNAMEACYDQYTAPHSQTPFTFELQYSGTYNAVYIGYMIVAINQRQRSGPYIWNVYVNDAVINNGLDSYELQPGDLIEFKYEPYSRHTITQLISSLNTKQMNKPNLFAGEPASNSFVRDSLSDDGSVPNMGALNGSPDIIPQLAPVDPGEVQLLYGAGSYNQDLGKNIEVGQTNYLYMRANNPTSQPQEVNIDVYWSTPGMLIHPSQWKPAQRIGAVQQMTIPANSVLAAPEPAMWTPAQLPTGGHYCLVLELTMNGQPGIPIEFPNLDAWWQYCRENNTIAQRNINIIDDLPNNRVESWVNLLNPDPAFRNHTIEAVCNVPIGSQVSLFCPSADLQPPINISSAITQVPQTISTAETSFPPQFQGTLQVVFQPPGSTVPGTYSIVIQQYADIDPNLTKNWNGQVSSVNSELVLLGSYIFEINL